jgi:rhodanese-related sulfurtransferase
MRYIPTIELAQLDDAAFLLDVREDDEWRAGRAPQAHHLPMSDVPARLAELPRDRAITVICRSGGRSAHVTEYLVAQGLEAVNLAGGMQAWEAAGRPLVADTPHPVIA